MLASVGNGHRIPARSGSGQFVKLVVVSRGGRTARVSQTVMHRRDASRLYGVVGGIRKNSLWSATCACSPIDMTVCLLHTLEEVELITGRSSTQLRELARSVSLCRKGERG